jgi:hypothetical protein
VLGGLSIPLLVLWTRHKRIMMEMQLMARGQANDNVTSAIEELRAEVRSLRDTSTQYDLSFDTAMQRLERRMDMLEKHALNTRHSQPENYETHIGR